MVEEKKVEEKTQVSPQSNLKMFVYGLVGILVLAVLIIGGVAVKSVNSLSQNSYILKVAKVLDLPAAKINGMKVSYTDYVDDLNTLNAQTVSGNLAVITFKAKAVGTGSVAFTCSPIIRVKFSRIIRGPP